MQGYRYGQVEPLVLLNLITSGPDGDRYFRVSFPGNRPRDSAARHILYAFGLVDPIYHSVHSSVPRSLRSFVRSPTSSPRPPARFINRRRRSLRLPRVFFATPFVTLANDSTFETSDRSRLIAGSHCEPNRRSSRTEVIKSVGFYWRL